MAAAPLRRFLLIAATSSRLSVYKVRNKMRHALANMPILCAVHSDFCWMFAQFLVYACDAEKESRVVEVRLNDGRLKYHAPLKGVFALNEGLGEVDLVAKHFGLARAWGLRNASDL